MITKVALIVAGGAAAALLVTGLVLPAAHKPKGDSTAEAQQDRSDPASAPASGPVPPTRIGVNLPQIPAFGGVQAFANLAIGGSWRSAAERNEPKKKKKKPDWRAQANQDGQDDQGDEAEEQDGSDGAGPNGELRSLSGGAVIRRLTPPHIGPKQVEIRCTYRGSADITVEGRPVSGVLPGKGELRFTWLDPHPTDAVRLTVRGLSEPITGLDCRDASLSPTVRFDPRFVESLKPFGVVRFMNWQNANDNMRVDWATRHTPASIDVMDRDGVAIEDIVALSNAAGVEPWVTVPWNATDDYIRRFAQMMHDGIPANRAVYVEVGNEVWNWRFQVTRQAAEEGTKAGLAPSDKGGEAAVLRYAQRTIEVMKIWEQAFRDKPSRLVRVAASQNGVPQRATLLAGYPGLLQHIDAFSSAPYFGFNVRRNKDFDKNPDAIFARVDQALDKSLASAQQYRAVAEANHKRYIAYEAGQSLVLGADVDLLEKVQRDPKMYGVYRRYLTKWRREFGDLIMLYNLSGPITRFGAWGMTEYSGQPLSEAPKMRAVMDEIGHP